MTKIINEFPNYSINIDGTVMNTNTKTVKTAWLGKNGYLHLDLYHNNLNKKVALHRLLAIHFLPNPNNKRTVNHIDGNKLNNTITNLEWATDSENIQHAYDNSLNYASNKKISDTAMDSILDRFFKGENLTSIIKNYDFSLPTLSTYLTKYAETKGVLEEFNTQKKLQKNQRAKDSEREKHNVTAISVTDPTDIRTYISLSEAARQLGKSSSGPISNVIAGRQKSAYGFIWTRSCSQRLSSEEE